MKRARILLGSILFLGLLGGALAFKPAKFFNLRNIYCPTTTPLTLYNYCPLEDLSKSFITGAETFPSYKCDNIVPTAYYTGFYTTTIAIPGGTTTATYCTSLTTGTVYEFIPE